MKRRYKALLGLGAIASGIWAFNASMFAPAPAQSMTLMSHRGVHQTVRPDRVPEVTNDSCTVAMIGKPTHMFVENTLPSMQAAFDFGADMIELDIHPTTDGDFAVFHDWTLECRTDGAGKTRDHSLAHLKTLDVGYGYTHDDGQSFLFRGEHIGAMPSLAEVLATFPSRKFMINIKSRDTSEGTDLAEYLTARNIAPERLAVYGHPGPVNAVRERMPAVMTFDKPGAKACLKSYILTGWIGRIPAECHNRLVPVPENYRWAVWGWPNRFQARLAKHNSRAMLIGPHTSARSNPAIDTLEQVDSVPKNFGGMVWTNRIEIVGPPLKGRRPVR